MSERLIFPLELTPRRSHEMRSNSRSKVNTTTNYVVYKTADKEKANNRNDAEIEQQKCGKGL